LSFWQQLPSITMSCVNQHVVMALVPKRQCNYQARNACVFQELNHKNQSIGADQQTFSGHCLSRCTLVTFLPLVRLCMMFKLALRAICTNRLSTLYYIILYYSLKIIYRLFTTTTTRPNVSVKTTHIPK